MYVPRLKKKYFEEVVPKLQEEFGYSSPMQVPRLRAVYLNQGLAKFKDQRRVVENGQEILSLIAGQRAVLRRAKRAISNFKLREGMVVATSVTLRGQRMWDFVDKLFHLGLARVRDFRGLRPSSFDGQGNYTLGLKEQIIFPEVNIDKVEKITGMNVTFVLSGHDRAVNYRLLRALGMPFSDMHTNQ